MKALFVLILVTFWTSSVGQNLKLDSVEFDLIYNGKLKKNESLSFYLNRFETGIKRLKPSRIVTFITDSTQVKISKNDMFYGISVLKSRKILGLTFYKRYEPIGFYQGQKYLVIERDRRIRRKYQFNWYWVDDLKFLREKRQIDFKS